jgi:hypothetical protein
MSTKTVRKNLPVKKVQAKMLPKNLCSEQKMRERKFLRQKSQGEYYEGHPTC